MSTPRICSTPGCEHSVRTSNPVCTYCRQYTLKKCAHDGCDNQCFNTYCRHHGYKLVPCSYQGCTKMCRKGLCGLHNGNKKTYNIQYRKNRRTVQVLVPCTST